MWIILWIILGALAGWIASIIMKKDSSMGAVANIIIGIAGAFIGGFIMKLFNIDGITGFNLWSLLVSVIGASVLLWIVNAIKR